PAGRGGRESARAQRTPCRRRRRRALDRTRRAGDRSTAAARAGPHRAVLLRAHHRTSLDTTSPGAALMLDALPKAAFSMLASSGALKRLASRYGMRRPDSFARRFIAGETVEEAIQAARRVEAAGLMQTLDYLGES